MNILVCACLRRLEDAGALSVLQPSLGIRSLDPGGSGTGDGREVTGIQVNFYWLRAG
jgi:hypothetical protein